MKQKDKKNDKPETDVKELERRVLELEKKAEERDEYYDKYIRSVAEHDNATKRMEKDKLEFARYANEKIISDLFPILDSFDKAMVSLPETEHNKTVIEGLKLLQKKFHKVLEDNGLMPINALGEKFDPIKHEAVMKIESNDLEDGTVCEELRKGYTLNGGVLRPAMVKVAFKKDASRDAKDDASEEKDENVS